MFNATTTVLLAGTLGLAGEVARIADPRGEGTNLPTR
jgi:hypothetical protein